MKIKQIYISNILEVYYKDYLLLGEKEKKYWLRYDDLDGNRALFYGRDNKAIITSSAINKDNFGIVCRLFDWKSVVNIFPQKKTFSICEDCISDIDLKEKLVDLIEKNPGVEIIPYRSTKEFYSLVKFLKSKKLKFEIPETIPQKQQFIYDYFNSKRGFRHLWGFSFKKKNIKINIPEGFIVGGKDEAIEAGWWFRLEGKSFVFKYNRGVQGIGVVFFDIDEVPKEKKDFITYVNSKLNDKRWLETPIVVEEKIDCDKTKFGGSPNVELYIKKNGQVLKSYPCEQILESDGKTFRGIYVHPKLSKSHHLQAAFTAAKNIGKTLAGFGYCGCFDMDLVISKKNELYAVEANWRRTGGTHLHETAQNLLGKNYFDYHHLVGEDIILSKKQNFKTCFRLLKNHIYNSAKKEGIIFSNPDMLEMGILNLFVIAKTKEKLDFLRKKAESLLSGR